MGRMGKLNRAQIENAAGAIPQHKSRFLIWLERAECVIDGAHDVVLEMLNLVP